jgi:hypothetical protein
MEPAKFKYALLSDIQHMAYGYGVDGTSFKGHCYPNEQI